MRRALALTATATTATALFVLTACSDGGQSAAPTASSTAPAGTTVQDDQGARHNEADVHFAQMMIPHHAQAIEMSDMLLAKDGIDERVTALAQQIKAAQTPEIEQLSAWLREWGQPVLPTDQPDAHSGMPDHDMPTGEESMAGMMTAEDMQALSDAQGAEAARLFLEQMTAHHQGAIAMAQEEVDNGEHPGAIEMARSIVTTQQQEIDAMRQLLASL
jgi:uncharacterized protein (DUF305 family)